MKKTIVLFCCYILILLPVSAAKGVKFIAEAYSDFNPDNVTETQLEFKNQEDVEVNPEFIIPEDSVLITRFVSSTSEKRFHKNGFFTCKLVKYTHDGKDISVEDKNIKMIGKRYEKIDGKEAALAGTEFAATTAAGFILPGVDIVYYFVKGAVQNTKADTRFKSGVHNAYDNSILWIFLKGKPIAFKKGDYLSILMCEDDESVSDKQLEKLCD